MSIQVSLRTGKLKDGGIETDPSQIVNSTHLREQQNFQEFQFLLLHITGFL